MAKSDTIKGIVENAIEAQKELPRPPDYLQLDDIDLQFYFPIVAGRAPSEWSNYRITLAAQLAQAQAELFRQRKLMKDEGAVIENDRGTRVANPRCTVMAQMSQQILALTRSLALQVQSDPRDQNRKDRSFQGAKKAADQLADEELLS
jgi:hypothetical protein